MEAEETGLGATATEPGLGTSGPTLVTFVEGVLFVTMTTDVLLPDTDCLELSFPNNETNADDFETGAGDAETGTDGSETGLGDFVRGLVNSETNLLDLEITLASSLSELLPAGIDLIEVYAEVRLWGVGGDKVVPPFSLQALGGSPQSVATLSLTVGMASVFVDLFPEGEETTELPLSPALPCLTSVESDDGGDDDDVSLGESPLSP